MEIDWNKIKADFLTLLDYHKETLDLDIELWYRKHLKIGYDKYEKFNDNQLLAIRNHLHGRDKELSKKLYEQFRVTGNSREVS